MKKLRIFLVIGGKATPGDASNGMWIRNLYDPLVALGHDVHLLNTDLFSEELGLGYMTDAAKLRLSNDLPGIFLKEHSKKPFDICFSYLHNGQIIPDVLKEIKRHVFTINYSTNYHQFAMYREIASIVDFNIYISKIAKEGFDSIGAKSYWMPLATNPDFYKPSTNKNDHVVFIGSVYGPRPYLFWRLLQYGVDLQLYGHGWIGPDKEQSGVKSLIKKLIRNASGYSINRVPASTELELANHYNGLNHSVLQLMRKNFPDHLHASLSDHAYVQTLSEAGTVVNIQESRYNHDYLNHQVLYGSNLRDFETTMSGSFLCTQYSTEIEELFDVGKEIVCYHNEHDLAEKITYYEKHQDEKVAIASAGYTRSLNSHTWEHRFKTFFEEVHI